METGRKIISYSLYGNTPRYTAPLLANSKIVTQLYPGWKIYVYHDNTVNEEYLSQLKQNGVVTINIVKLNNKVLPPKMWRFLPATDVNVDLIIIRDADSLLTQRERELVIEWEESDKSVHIMRDHPLHTAPILAGMFGMKRDSLQILSKLLEMKVADVNKRPHDYDQVFLADYLYPKIKNLALIHVSFFRYYNENVIKIDPVSDGRNYIGSVFNGDELKNEKERNILMKSKFINGIPYSMAKLLRYHGRPIIYSSILFNFLLNIIGPSGTSVDDHKI